VKSRIAVIALAATVVAAPVATAQASPRKSGVAVTVDKSGKAITIVGKKGKLERVALKTSAPRGLKAGTNVSVAGGKVVSAKGKSRGVKVRAVIKRVRGKLAAVTPAGTNVQDLIGRVRLALNGIPEGETVAVRLSFAASGTPTATVEAPGGDAYSDPYTDPYEDPYPDPETCEQEQQQAEPWTVIAVSVRSSKIMVANDDRERKVFTFQSASIAELRRGMRVVVTDANADGVAEAVTPATRSREVEGTVAWIDNDFGAFGLEDERGRVWVVNATECQLGLLTAGGGAEVTLHRDASGELIADVVEATSAPDDSGYEDPYGEDGDEDGQGDDEGRDDEDGDDEGHGHHGRGHRKRHGGREFGFGGQRWSPFFDRGWGRLWR